MEEFSGATTISVFQEFYIGLLFSNLSSLVKNQADEEIQSTYKRTNQYRYQANRSFIIGHLKSLFPKILCCLLELSAIDHLYKEALRCKSQIIPERSFPRKKNKAIGRGIKKYLFNLLHFKKQYDLYSFIKVCLLFRFCFLFIFLVEKYFYFFTNFLKLTTLYKTLGVRHP